MSRRIGLTFSIRYQFGSLMEIDTRFCSGWIVDDDEDDQEFIRSAFLTGDSSIQSFMLNDGEYVERSLLVCYQLPQLI